MYEGHFGLERRLFDGLAQDADVFASRGHALMAERFKLALTAPDAVITVSGPPGIGKSTLTSATLRASSTRLAIAWLNGTPTNGTELLELLLLELGLNAHRSTRIERLQIWRQFHNEMSATQSRVFIVVERTEDLDAAVLHALDALTAADTNGSAGANLVLLGHSHLEQHLAVPVLESLRQRIRLRLKLEPFSPTELEDYLRQQFVRVGGNIERVLATSAVEALHRHSGGVARVVNHLLETALALAASEGAAQLTPELVARTATEILGVPTSKPASDQPDTRGDAPPASAAAAPPAHAAPIAAVTVPMPTVAVTSQFTWSPLVSATVVAAPPLPIGPALPDQGTPVRLADPLPAARAAPPALEPKPASIEPKPTAPPSLAAREPIAPAVAAPPPPAATPLATPTPHAATMAPSKPATTAAAAAPRELLISRPEPAPALSDFDATVTDIPDVSLIDFPVLTDAVEEPMPSKRTASEPLFRAQPPQRELATPKPDASVMPTPADAPPPVAARRVDTAYAKRPPASGPAAPSTAPAAPPKPPAATPPSAAPASVERHGDDDAEHQTQTLRAISVAKSIDDISNSMAETLFGDADLEMLSAALASAGWSDADEPGAAPAAAAPPPAAPKKPPAAPSVDDSFDLFDLGDDAPLELLDDAHSPEGDRSRRASGRR